jgi:hypothetical protein
MKESGERASFDDGRPQKASNNTRLSDLGITRIRIQSHRWQKNVSV